MMGDAKGEEARPAPGVLPVPPLLPQARRDRLGSRVPSSPGCREPKGSRESTEEPHGKRVRGRGAAAACPHPAREGGRRSEQGEPGGGVKGVLWGVPGCCRFSGQSPSRGTGQSSRSLLWGAGFWWEVGKMGRKPAEEALAGCLGESP